MTPTPLIPVLCFLIPDSCFLCMWPDSDQTRELLANAGNGEGDAVNALMGSKPEARFRFIQDRAAFAKDLDI